MADVINPVQTFTGPRGNDAADWDSVYLELHNDSRFVLELWQFAEAYRVPFGAVAGADESRPRASFKQLDETRVTLKGCYVADKAPAIRLRGLQQTELNCEFVEDPSLRISGQSTWWTADGQRFIYFVESDAHWKINAVRAIGGDGIFAVSPGGRRAGRGYAHSGPVELRSRRHPASALSLMDGWFENIDGKWLLTHVDISFCDVDTFKFIAEETLVEESAIRGEDRNSSRRKTETPATFRALCFGAAYPSRYERILLASLVIPDLDETGQLDVSEPASTNLQQGGFSEPSFIVLGAVASARL